MLTGSQNCDKLTVSCLWAMKVKVELRTKNITMEEKAVLEMCSRERLKYQVCGPNVAHGCSKATLHNSLSVLQLPLLYQD